MSVHYIAAVVAWALWMPSLVRFRRQWHERRNPLSLAIMVLIVFQMLLAATPFWLAIGAEPIELVPYNEVLGLIVAGPVFLGAWWMSNRRFKSARRPPSAG